MSSKVKGRLAPVAVAFGAGCACSETARAKQAINIFQGMASFRVNAQTPAELALTQPPLSVIPRRADGEGPHNCSAD